MALFTKGVDICKTLIICRTILSNQKSCGVLRFQECLAFRWNWQKQMMFVGHEFWDQRNNALECFRSSLGQVSFFHRRGFVQRDPHVVQFGEIDWLQCSWLIAIASHQNMLCWTGIKLVFFASKACWRMDSCSQCDFVISTDFYHSRCASFFALNILVTGFRILPSLMWRLHLDDLAGNGMKKGPQS